MVSAATLSVVMPAGVASAATSPGTAAPAPTHAALAASTVRALPTAPTAPVVPAGVSPAAWVRVRALSGALRVIRSCEASGNYKANTGNGYFGAYQFSAATWKRLGLRGLPHQASPAVQDAAAVKLHDSRHSWADWGACGSKAAHVHA